MKRRPTSILTTLAVSVLAVTLIAPWVLGQDLAALTEIRRGAEQGDPYAQFILAAEQGHAGAQAALGAMYATGAGVLKNSVLAHMWYTVADANGHPGAWMRVRTRTHEKNPTARRRCIGRQSSEHSKP